MVDGHFFFRVRTGVLVESPRVLGGLNRTGACFVEYYHTRIHECSLPCYCSTAVRIILQVYSMSFTMSTALWLSCGVCGERLSCVRTLSTQPGRVRSCVSFSREEQPAS